MSTVGISMQLQWDPLMRDQHKGVIIANLSIFSIPHLVLFSNSKAETIENLAYY